jgi:hypothetical protein
MLVLDENLPASQRQLLRKWRIHVRAIGVDIAAPGSQDENLIPVLQKLAQPMFFTLDQHFFRADWAHASYGLAWLDVPDSEAAEFIRRFLRHPSFDTQSKRMGVVARVTSTGVRFWRKGQPHLQGVMFEPSV